MGAQTHRWFVAALVAIGSACDAGRTPTEEPDGTATGKNDEPEASLDVAELDVVFSSGLAVEADAVWPTDPAAVAERVTWSTVVYEGNQVLSRNVKHTELVSAPVGAASRRIDSPFFDDLGMPSDATTALRIVEVTAQIESCADPECEALTAEAVVLRRPVSIMVRPFPAANLKFWGGVDYGVRNDDALQALTRVVGETCDNVLITMNGSAYEGFGGADAAWAFMSGRNYDCTVSVAYHDGNNGWGSWSNDDSLQFCQSTELGTEALRAAFDAAVVDTEVAAWDVYGHSKGGAAAVRFYGFQRSTIAKWPDSRVFTIGLPWRMGAQYLPEPDDYEVGRIYGDGQVVAFTWTNDAVRDIDTCADLDAASVGDNHDYTPIFYNPDDEVSRADDRRAFERGTPRWLGERYE